MSTRIVTLTYTVGMFNDMNLDFVQQGDENSEWTCTLTADEMNQLLRAANEDGKLDD